MSLDNIRGICVFDLDDTIINKKDESIKYMQDFVGELETLGFLVIIVTARLDCDYRQVHNIVHDKMGLRKTVIWCLPMEFLGWQTHLENENIENICQIYKSASRYVIGTNKHEIPVVLCVGDMSWDVTTKGVNDVTSLTLELCVNKLFGIDSSKPWYAYLSKHKEKMDERKRKIIDSLKSYRSDHVVSRENLVTSLQYDENSAMLCAFMSSTYVNGLHAAGDGGNLKNGGSKTPFRQPTTAATVSLEDCRNAINSFDDIGTFYEKTLGNVEKMRQKRIPPERLRGKIMEVYDEAEGVIVADIYVPTTKYVTVSEMIAHIYKSLDMCTSHPVENPHMVRKEVEKRLKKAGKLAPGFDLEKERGLAYRPEFRKVEQENAN